MKKQALLLVLAFFCIRAYCQVDTLKSWQANLDYSTPSDPAFKILGTDPDNILKPTSAKAVALNIGNYFINGGSVIPKSLSVEISPLLLNQNANIQDYQHNVFWYRMRFSFGTAQNAAGATKVAEGIKFTIFDKSDPKINEKYLNDLASVGKKNAISVEAALEQYANERKIPNSIALGDKYQTDTTFKKMIDSLRMKKPTEKGQLQTEFKNTHWNAAIWDVGIATLQTSKDSLVKNLQFSKIGLWSTIGLPITNKGQLLIGGRAEAQDSVKWQTNFSMGTRFYYGVNNTKVYAQGEYKNQNSLSAADFGVGCLFNITNGLWGQIGFNVVLDNTGKLSYAPSFNIGLSTGDSKK